ncbi:MAG: hypothetical protein U0744_01515 [Gemmataceae bacterium]
MPFQAACPACNAKINVPDAMAGKKAKCPKCANIFVLPGGEDAISANPAPAPTPARPSRRPADDADFDDAPVRRGRGGDDYDAPRPTGGTNGLAIAGMVLGIVGLVLAFIPCVGWILGIILGIVGAALSGIGLSSANKSGSGKGMAISGLILSILAIVVAISYWIYVAFVFNAAANQLNNLKNQIQINDKKVNFNDAFKDAFKDAGKIDFGGGNHPPVAGNAKVVAVGDINIGERKQFQISFNPGQKAEIWVKSDLPGDVDLFVKDKGGAQVAGDGGLSKDAYVTFVPMFAEPYTVEVANSAGPNRCTLHHTGK